MPIAATAEALPRIDIMEHIREYDPERSDAWDSFIAREVFTPARVQEMSGRIPKIAAEEFLKRAESIKRARGSGFKRITYKVEKHDFDCEEFGVEAPYDAQDEARFGGFGINEETNAELAMYKMLMEEEFRAANLTVNDATTYPNSGTTGLNVSTPWSTHASATPIANVRTGIAAVFAKSGIRPNALIVSWDTALNIADTAEFQEKVKYTNAHFDRDQPDWNVVARALGLKKLIVGGKPYDTTPEGVDMTVDEIWDPALGFLTVVETNPAMQVPKIGHTLYYDADDMGGLEFIDQYDEPQNRSLVMRARQCVETNRIHTQLGFRFTNLAA